jgi:hypothetical protein
MIRIGIVITLLTAMGCAPAVVTPLPPTVRRIAVLPPYYRGAVEIRTASADTALVHPFEMTVGDVLVQQARTRLAEKGLDVIAPSVVKLATQDRMPTSAQMAAQIMEDAHLDATALYIEVRRWE